MISFVHGPDRYLARQSVQALISEADPAGANTTWVDGRESTPEKLVHMVGAATFFGEPRVVVVEGLLSRSDSAIAPQGRQGRAAPALERLLSSVPEQNWLIFFEPAMSSLPAAIKPFSAKISVIGAEAPRGAPLLQWIATAADRAGSRIDRGAAQFLAETLFPQSWHRKSANPRFERPPDMALLDAEIAKLALAAHPGAIETRHIMELVPGGADPRLFRLMDAAIAGDVQTALVELERLVAAGEDPAATLAQLLGQVETAVIAAVGEGQDAATVARELGAVTPARVSAVMTSARRASASQMRDAVTAGVSVDRQLKTGRLRRPDDALHALLLALFSKVGEHTAGRLA
jgi:DNA polymerase III delta subunit